MDSLSGNKTQKKNQNKKNKKANKYRNKKVSVNNSAKQEGEYVYKVSRWLQLL